MNENLISKVQIVINATAPKVWDALINPELVRQYLFGTEVISDWKVGSPIIWKGIWDGKTYEDKGTILQFVPEKILEATYWSSMSGIADIPENYKKVTYELLPDGNTTLIKITQDNNANEDEKKHSEENWKSVLIKLKAILES